MKREFTTEYCIGYLNSYTAMVTAHQLLSDNKMSTEQVNSLSECHIYAITAIPAPYFKENSIRYDKKGLSGILCYKVNGVEKEIAFENFPWQLDDNAVSIKCEYPHKEIRSYDINENECTY